MKTATATALVSLVTAGLLGATGTAAQQQEPPEDERPVETRKMAVRSGPWGGGPGGHLGVEVDDLDRGAAEEAGLERVRGVRVTGVSDGSPAEEAGLRSGDVILRFDGEDVRSVRHLVRLVRETPPGRTVDVRLLREGERRTVEVRVGERTAGWPGLDPERMEEIHDRIEDAMSRGREAGERLRRMRGVRELQDRLDDLDLEVDGRLFAFGDRGRLGVRLQPLTDQLAEHFGAGDGGALVASVRDDSPAADAGLRAGDVIVRVGDEDVRGPGDAARAVRRAEPGPTTVEVVRDGEERSLTVELPERASGEETGAADPADPPPAGPTTPSEPEAPSATPSAPAGPPGAPAAAPAPDGRPSAAVTTTPRPRPAGAARSATGRDDRAGH